jgi:hypothetical protein
MASQAEMAARVVPVEQAALVVEKQQTALTAMAARVVLVATVAWVAMVPLASMVRCLVIQELLAEWAATAAQVDSLDSAARQAALEP